MPESTSEDTATLPTQTGLYALVAVARHLGLDWSLTRILHLYGGESEPMPERLAVIARSEGLKSSYHKIDWARLDRFQAVTPFLVRLTNNAYVVVLKVNVKVASSRTEIESLSIFNPRFPDAIPTDIPKEEFTAHWAGEIVLLKRVFSLTDATQPFGLAWFGPEFWRQRDLLRNVVIAALAMHVLALAVPIFFQIVIDRVLAYLNISTLIVIGVGVVIAIVFDACLNWLRGYFLLRSSSRIDIRLARTTFRHLMALSVGFFERLPAGVVTKHIQQVGQIREFLSGRLLTTLLDLPALLVFLPLMIWYSGWLTLVVLFITALLAGVIAVMLGPYRRRLKLLYAAEAARQSLLVESIHGIRTIKSLNLEPRREMAWSNAAAEAVKTYIEVGKISLAANSLSQFIERALTVIIVVVGTFLVFAGDLTVGGLVAFNMLSSRVTSPVLQLIGLLNNYQEALLSVDMLGVVMNTPTEQGGIHGLTPALEGAIDFDEVTFRYPGSERPALDGLSVHIPHGKMVGIVGRSGSGKTTLSALLQGLYQPQAGTIKIDGHNIGDIDLSFLRGQMGVVPQEPFLFRGTVKDNIRMGMPAASFEDIVEAARIAGADEFIDLLPQRYDSLLEEGAVNLSGGQKQRISIARAVLRSPPIIIFDEATSALDPESEAIIVRNLRQIAKGRTTVVISHRLQTIRNADVIVVMECGTILDQGKHDELLERNDIYRLLWAQQMLQPS
jgi:ATP-binding cassette subfamily B protein